VVNIPPAGYTDPARQVVIMPDIEVLAGLYLKDQLGTDATVYTALPSTVDYTKPVVRLNRIGGTWRIRGVLDEPTLDVDLWGKAPAALKTMTERVRGYLMAANGVMHNGAVITRVSEVAGPLRRPEDDPSLYRIGFTVALLVHPAA
jgi:hypothetical protein